MKYNVKASSFLSSKHSPDNIISISDNRYWTSAKGDTEGAWLEFDFAGEATFNAIKIEEYKENDWGNVKEFKILVLNDNQWHEILIGQSIYDSKTITFPKQKSSRIKIIFTRLEENSVGVSISYVKILLDDGSEINDDGEFKFPLYFSNKNNTGNVLYLFGGYHSYSYGCPVWGSIRENDSLYVGDEVGNLKITYENGEVDSIPLILGYTAWFNKVWNEAREPFDSEDEMRKILMESLFIEGAFECAEETVLKIRIRNIPIMSIKLENSEKIGTVLFRKGYLLREDNESLLGDYHINHSFFETHTVDSKNPYPNKNLIEALRYRLYTFENDFINVESFTYPADYKRAIIEFKGDSYANILTRVFYDNIEDMITKIDQNGMVNESTKDAPCWLYNGFGTWIPNRGTYHGLMYSRNHRGTISVSVLDLIELAEKTVEFDNDMLMYFKKNKLCIGRKQIPGHWCVLVNDPLYYSTVLTGGGWPTKYTEDVFLDEYKNLGNHEPDGHGYIMIAIARVWEQKGYAIKWVENNWDYLCEAVEYIDWCLNNPSLSFSEHGLLYGESEGGMLGFTMYNNVPCYLGLRMYIKMAISANKYEEANKWALIADNMEESILKYFVKENNWDLEKVGFFNPSLTFYSDIVGYDVKNDAPDLWYKLSENSYSDDLKGYIGSTYLGVRGLGYDHNMITQTSLLLDKTFEYDKLVKNLAKLCYSPRLPGPFIVPECASYSESKKLYRRLGDLGNYVQQSETISTILMIAGVSKTDNNVVKVLPRLPENWSVKVNSLTIPGTHAKISYEAQNPVCNSQIIKFCIDKKANIETVKFRLGPFTSKNIVINNEKVIAEKIGDSYWAWCTITGVMESIEYKISSYEGD